MCDISIPFKSQSNELVQKAKSAINSAGGDFDGDHNTGSFSLKTPIGFIKGGYIVEGQLFNITINDKPFIISCNRIEDELRKYMEE